MAKSNSSLNPTVVDAASLFDASEVIVERLSRRITVDYAKLRECLDAMRKDRGWRPASPNTILLSIDPDLRGAASGSRPC